MFFESFMGRGFWTPPCLKFIAKQVAFIFLMLMLGYPCDARSQSVQGQSSLRAEYKKNIHEGFAATAGFEIVTMDRLHVHAQNTVTYRLDPDPDAYKVKDEGLGHIRWVTLAWRESRDASPFVFDFYLHGDMQDKNPLAIHIPQLDIRKFLHQSIAGASVAVAHVAPSQGKALGASPTPFSDNIHLTRLQAYFEEFARKTKIIYRLAGVAPLPSESLDRTLPVFAQRIADVKITNNCREPGNYEIEIRDSNGRYLLRANFSFPTKDYDFFLVRYHGVGIAGQGTGIGVPRTIRNQEPLRYWDSFLPWKRMKSFPKVNIEALSVIRATDGEQPQTITHPHPHPDGEGILDSFSFNGERKGDGLIVGEIDVVKGRIPFKDYKYDPEVINKGGDNWLGPEPLSYVRVNGKLPIPVGFKSPDKKFSPDSYWTSKAHLGNVVPYHFQTFEDIQRYDVYLSGFDLNGVYIGRSDLHVFDKERKKGRWHFNFQYLQKLNRFEFREGNGLIEIRLLNEFLGKRSVNFIFGNFSVQVGKPIEFLLGLAPQPLIAAYNHNPYQETMVYGFAYDANGQILDHHDLGIGVEKVSIERIDTETYKVRLISYERILPVWEGMIRSAGF